MDEWESLRLKIKELETNFLRGSAPAGISTQEVPGAEYWKKKFDEERLTWQKALEEKDREQSILQERYVKDEEGVSLLIQKIGHLEKKLDSERALWEEKSRVRLLESELSAVKNEWEDRASQLLRQNKALQDKLEKSPEQALEEEKVLNGLKAEKLKAEQAAKALEDQIHQLKQSSESAAQKLAAEKKSLEETLAIADKERAQTKARIQALEAESGTLRKARDLAMDRMKQREKERLQEFEDLVQGFSHRIKNYAGIMTGTFGETAAAGDEAEKQKFEALFRENAKELSSLTYEFLKFSQVPSVVEQDLDLNLLAARALAAQNGALESKKIIVKKEFSVDLPKIRGDEALVVSVFEEIISNAADAMEPGKTLFMSISVRAEERLAVASVKDEGPGISPVLLEKIFRPFYTTRKGRRGLGLSRARRNMDLNSGSIRVSSIEGRGTTVTLEFPLAL